jgi:hypothetical protein
VGCDEIEDKDNSIELYAAAMERLVAAEQKSSEDDKAQHGTSSNDRS